jgi:hypothetical protein
MKETHVNFLTDPLEGRSTLRPTDVLVYRWVGEKHAFVNLTEVSPFVRLTTEDYTVGQVALEAASNKMFKHERAYSDNQFKLFIYYF